MTDTSLPPELQIRLDEHLDAVDEVLRRHDKSRTERSTIVDELANQIIEMLTDQAGPERGPSTDDLDTVLSQIDPPEAYAKHSVDLDPRANTAQSFSFPEEKVESRLNRAALFATLWWGWCLFAVAAGLYLNNTVVYSDTGHPRQANQTGWGIALIVIVCIPGFLAPLGSSVLGWIALQQIKRSRGSQYGLRLAAFNALSLVTILVSLVVLFVLYAQFASNGDPNTPEHAVSWMLIALIAIPICLAVWFAGPAVVRRLI